MAAVAPILDPQLGLVLVVNADTTINGGAASLTRTRLRLSDTPSILRICEP